MSKLDRCSLLAGDECTSLAELREQNEELQAQVAGMKALLQRYIPGCDGCEITFAQEAQALLFTPTAGEWVIITKTDAYTAMQWAEKYGFLPMANRLKAALGTTGEEE